MINRTCVTAIVLVLILESALPAAHPPMPFGPVPSERQLFWSRLGQYAFVHFTINTFTDKEWGYGDESPALFNPTDFDADQIVTAARDAGLKGVVLTCKHHDGFCLWPTKFTEHSVKNSPWKNGKGDLVREIAEACQRHDLKFGIYLSPWDRNSAVYGKPEYITYYRNQLRELLTGYGPIFEVWLDGANGGDGFYGGAREVRKIDNTVYYDWKNTIEIIRKLQPQAVIFSDGGPDVRWCGNEQGHAGETCWQTLNVAGVFPGHADSAQLNRGDRPGTDWLPAEVDVSIRPGWFWHAREDSHVKTPEQLTKIYFESVGRGANLILNLPPDRRGRIPDGDVKSLRDWRSILDQTFAKNLADGAKALTEEVRGNDPAYAAANLLDSSGEKYWTTDDAVTTPSVVIELPKPVTFDVIQLREYLPLGQRVDRFSIETWKEDKWQPLAEGTSVGNRRLLRTGITITSKLRLSVTQAGACPAIWGFGLFKTPDR